MVMCDKELLVGYLYDELEESDRQAFDRHLATCADCRGEVQALQGTRGHLATWAPAEPDLRFEIVRRSESSTPVSRRSPLWGLAAAAAIVLAAASAIANVEIRIGRDGFVVRTGSARDAEVASTAPLPQVPASVSREELVALQQRVNELQTTMTARNGALSSSAPAAGPLSEAEIVRRMRQMIGEAESRLDQKYGTQLVTGLRQMQAAHTLDLVRLEQAINRSQAAWNDEIFRQREDMKNVFRLVNQQR